MASNEAEWKTRKKRIDPRLDAGGWPRSTAPSRSFRSEEEETANGSSDYALWLDDKVVGVVEAKKLTVGPQNVLTHAARYARGLDPNVGCGSYEGHCCPFVYSTNGEVLWFHDVRHPLNRPRRIAGFHTAKGLREALSRDFDADCAKALALPDDHSKLRPYQKDANAAVERAFSEQREIVGHIDRLFDLADTIERRVQAATARADRLPHAILSRAFAGELVPTEAELARAEGRTYETAEELLAREKATPASNGASAGSNGGRERSTATRRIPKPGAARAASRTER